MIRDVKFDSNLRRVPVGGLEIGMFVASLDRPWLETTFLVQGFFIEGQNEIEQLQKYCQWVSIDITKGRSLVEFNAGDKSIQSTNVIGDSSIQAIERDFEREVYQRVLTIQRVDSSRKNEKSKSNRQELLEEWFPDRNLHSYTNQTVVSNELIVAKKIYREFESTVVLAVNDAVESRHLDMARIEESVEPLVGSVVRNPDACIWLAKMRTKEVGIFRHAVACSVWAVTLGRQLGLPKEDLQSLAVGGLLLDVGKLMVPQQLMNKVGKLTSDEFSIMKSHVERGLDLLYSDKTLSQDVVMMVQHHHERHDGSGYPKGLKGTQIPVLGRIAAIVDCYDAVTHDRPYASAISPSEAIRSLHMWRDKEFQGALVDEFVQAIGVYPAGTLVELSTGEVAVVIGENQTQRLRPQVLVILNHEKKAYPQPLLLDLSNVTKTIEGNNLNIERALEHGAYGLGDSLLDLFSI